MEKMSGFDILSLVSRRVFKKIIAISIVLLMFFQLAGTSADQELTPNWTEIHGGQAHTGYSSVEIAPPLKLLWKANIAPDDHMSVVGCWDESKPRIFTADTDGNLLCLFPSDGNVIWKYEPSKGRFHDSPIIATLSSGKNVVIAISSQKVFAKEKGIDICCIGMDGKLVWKLGIDNVYTDCAPTCSDGFIYVSTGILRGQTSYQCKVLKLNLENGDIVWQTTLSKSPLAGGPTVANGKVFVCCSNFEYSGEKNSFVMAYKSGAVMYSLDAETGKLAGKFEPGSMYMDITPVYYDGKLLVSGHTTVLEEKTKPDPTDPAKLIKEEVEIPTNFITKLNPNDLSPDWSVNSEIFGTTDNPSVIYAHPPVVSGDWVINGSDEGYLYGFNTKENNKKWSLKAGIGIRLGIVATDNYIYLNEGNTPSLNDQKARAKFKVLELETGKTVWEYEMEALGRCAVTVFDRFIYTYDKKNLYCFVKYEPPNLVVEPKVIDLGEIATDETKSFSFKAYNSGDGKIVCLSQFDDFFLSTKFMKFELTRTPIEVTFTVHPGLLLPGYDFKSTIRILGDNNQVVDIMLKFRTTNREKLQVTPAYIDFGRVSKGFSPQSSITLENIGRGLLSGTITTDADWLILSASSWEGNEKSIIVTADTSDLEPGKTYSATITVESNGGNRVVNVTITILNGQTLTICSRP